MKRRALLVTALTTVIIAAGSGFGHQQIQGAQEKPNRSKVLKTKKTTSVAKVEQTAEQANQAIEASQPSDAQNNAQGQSQSQDDQNASQTTTTDQVSTATATASASTTANRTDGFNFAGQHFDVTTFSNTSGGNTPRWTPYIFQWSAIPNYYLAEAASKAGSAVRQLSYGSEAVVNGRTYHVSEIHHGMKRLDSLETVQDLADQHAIGIQTCDDASGTYVSTYWFD